MTDALSYTEPRISVALCSYNGAAYLGDQLRSIAQQTRAPDELVVVDDASTDTTGAIVEAFAQTVPFPVRWHRNERTLGVVRNFERAIGLTLGTIVFLSDQDDVWLPEKVGRTLELFDAPDVLLVHTDARLVDAQLADLGSGLLEALEFTELERDLFASGRGHEVLLRRSLVTGATAAIRRGLYEAARPFGEGWVHDEWLALLAALLGRVRRVDDAMVLYRQHGRNQIGARKRSWSQRLIPESRLGRLVHRARAESLERARRHLEAKQLSVDTGRLRELDAAILHARFRAEVPDFLPARMLSVAQELASGRYRRYSNGWKGALRDVVEPVLLHERGS